MAQTVDIKDLSVARQIARDYKDVPGCIMPILQKTQEKYGCLSFEIQQALAEELDMPVSELYGVATFYSQFSLERKGDYKIGVCLGTACYVKKSQDILDELQKQLNLEVGHTTPDHKFTLEATRCLGCCGLAPVMMINDDVYGGLVPEDIAAILAKY